MFLTLQSALIIGQKLRITSSATFTTIVTAAASGLMSIGAGFATVVLVIFFQRLRNADDANAICTCTFLLGHGYH